MPCGAGHFSVGVSVAPLVPAPLFFAPFLFQLLFFTVRILVSPPARGRPGLLTTWLGLPRVGRRLGLRPLCGLLCGGRRGRGNDGSLAFALSTIPALFRSVAGLARLHCGSLGRCSLRGHLLGRRYTSGWRRGRRHRLFALFPLFPLFPWHPLVTLFGLSAWFPCLCSRLGRHCGHRRRRAGRGSGRCRWHGWRRTRRSTLWLGGTLR